MFLLFVYFEIENKWIYIFLYGLKMYTFFRVLIDTFDVKGLIVQLTLSPELNKLPTPPKKNF